MMEPVPQPDAFERGFARSGVRMLADEGGEHGVL